MVPIGLDQVILAQSSAQISVMFEGYLLATQIFDSLCKLRCGRLAWSLQSIDLPFYRTTHSFSGLCALDCYHA